MKRIIKTIIYAFISIGILLLLAKQINVSSKQITYSDFMEKTEQGDIEKVIIDGDTLKIYPYDSQDYYTTAYIEDESFVNYLTEQEVTVEKKSENQGILITILPMLIYLIPLTFIVLGFISMTRNQGDSNNGISNIFNAGKNKSKMYKEDNTGKKFSDVAGQDEAKESLVEIIDYLHNAKKYQSIGAKLPKGALLVGPPGTGKTLLAKAVAGEAGVPFFSTSGPEFVEMFVGVGASRVRDLFEEAKKSAPCIIFIDEIDAIGKKRDVGGRTGGHDEREQTLNQLLTEMDGFDSSKAIVVLAATNRPETLDKALLRAGRFDRRIIVDKPDLKGREAILKVHIKDVCIDESVDLKAIAQATAGAVGADLANMINEAALRAVKLKRTAVSQEDLMESIETVIAGKEKKDRIMSEDERRIVAYHEVGHAVVAALQKNSAPVQKITIVPRTMGSLGYTMQVPEEEKFLSSKEEMIEEIRTLIGGRCAEEIFFNKITSGASNDIEKVTEIARKMVTVYGMTDKFDMIAFENSGSYYLDDTPYRNCSEETSALIDNYMIELVKGCHKDVEKMIDENKDLMNEVAEYLLLKENITGDEFMDIFCKYHKVDNRKKTTPKENPFVNIEDTLKSIINDTKEISKNTNKKDEEVEDIVELPIENDFESPIDDISTLEEPIIIEDVVPEEIVINPMDDIPMPDFSFPFDRPLESENSSTNVSVKEESKIDDKKSFEAPKTFEAPKPLQKKKKKKPSQNNQQNRDGQNNKEEPKSDMEILLNGVKNNPEELAQKSKNGTYLSNKQKQRLDNNETSTSNNKSDEVSEDDY